MGSAGGWDDMQRQAEVQVWPLPAAPLRLPAPPSPPSPAGTHKHANPRGAVHSRSRVGHGVGAVANEAERVVVVAEDLHACTHACAHACAHARARHGGQGGLSGSGRTDRMGGLAPGRPSRMHAGARPGLAGSGMDAMQVYIWGAPPEAMQLSVTQSQPCGRPRPTTGTSGLRRSQAAGVTRHVTCHATARRTTRLHGLEALGPADAVAAARQHDGPVLHDGGAVAV